MSTPACIIVKLRIVCVHLNFFLSLRTHRYWNASHHFIYTVSFLSNPLTFPKFQMPYNFQVILLYIQQTYSSVEVWLSAWTIIALGLENRIHPHSREIPFPMIWSILLDFKVALWQVAASPAHLIFEECNPLYTTIILHNKIWSFRYPPDWDIALVQSVVLNILKDDFP